MSKIDLDPKQLLGFRLLDETDAKVLGAKIGGKIGNKAGIKAGIKVGIKVGTKD